MRSLLRIADLSAQDVDWILERAEQWRADRGLDPRQCRLASLIFLEPSLRTRVGYHAAASRLGWNAVDVYERRHSPTSMMESWHDTLRTVAGYSDVIVARPGLSLTQDDVDVAAPCPLINGGDVAPNAEHPSQSLIDVFALQQLVGPLSEIHLGVVGDPRMRAVRSLLALLGRMPPAALTIVVDKDHAREIELSPALATRTNYAGWDELRDADAVYVAGIPHGALPLDRRETLLATAPRVGQLPKRCVLLSPMPVIDEMDEAVRRDPRNRMFEQSNLAIHVRTALLEYALREEG